MSEVFTPKTMRTNGFPFISDSVVISAGQNVLKGTVLGKKTLGAVTSAAKSGGNTGTGTLTLPVKGVKAKLGVYTVRCVEAAKGAGAITSAAKTGGNTGAGTLTALSKGSNVKVGVYKLRCIAAGTGVGTFSILDPDGYSIGTVIASAGGTAFTSPFVNFTLTATGADFIVGDGFDITIAEAAGAGKFVVTDPNGIEIGAAVASSSGAAFSHEQIGFTLTATATNFVVGDGFDITVAAGSGEYAVCNSASVDGSQNPYCVAAEDMDATSAARNISVYLTGVFVATSLIFGGADTIATHEEALRTRNIYVQPIMPV